MYRIIHCLLTLLAVLAFRSSVHGQPSKLPVRANPPQFGSTSASDIFFADIETVLVGPLPIMKSSVVLSNSHDARGSKIDSEVIGSDSSGSRSESDEDGSTFGKGDFPWVMLVSASSLEDFVKESKHRVDRAITTPSAFAGGGFHEVRKEFSLLSLLFAIIENYSGEVRWKSSAASLKAVLNRTATNAKIGSRQVFEEAKRRKSDLENVLNGTVLAAEPNTEVAWENLMDIAPLMQLLGSAFDQQISQSVASESEFKKRAEELHRYSEFIAILGTAMTFDKMPYADEDQFRDYARELVQSARQVVHAVSQGDAVAARIAGGRMGQTCQKCHESYRF